MALDIINVHRGKSDDLINEIVGFWGTHGVLDAKMARERAPQVIYIVRGADQSILALSTAFITMVPNFKNNMFVYRCMAHPGKAVPGLIQELTIQTIAYLESVHMETKPKCIGVMAKIESPKLKKIRDIYSKSGLMFAGFAPDGDPIRVHFFKGAKF